MKVTGSSLRLLSSLVAAVSFSLVGMLFAPSCLPASAAPEPAIEATALALSPSNVALAAPDLPGADSAQQECLTRLENRFFAHSFAGESVEKRLSRLEAIMFGARSNKSFEERVEKLTAAADLGKIDNSKEQAEFLQATLERSKAAAKKPKKENFHSLYNAAMADLKLRRYHAAAEELLNAINHNPRYSPAYAYLGDVLIKLQDKPGALEAYRACFDVDPFGKFGRYGKAKLVALSAQAAYERTAPQDSPVVVERTIKMINRQSNDLGSRYYTDWDHWSNWRSALVGIRDRRVQEDAHDRARSVYGGNSRNGFYGGELSGAGVINNAYSRNDYMTTANRQRAEAARKSALVAQSAASLKEQMLQPQKAGSAKLRALGTNLYVRYYGSDTSSTAELPVPEDPPIELKATAAKLK